MQTQLKNFLTTKRGQVIAGIVITVLTLTGMYNFATDVEPFDQVLARATRTPTGIVTTAVPTSTSTLIPPTSTNTAVPSITPTLPIGVTVTATPVSGDPCSHWHPYQPDLRYPSLGAFDMGYNPCLLIPVFGDILENYLIDQNVDGLPHSSALEEPDGYTVLYVRIKADGTQDQLPIPGEGCALFDNDPADPTADKLCITNVAQRVHMRGDSMHVKKRNHSVWVVARACAISNGKPVNPCGVVFTSGIEDWGVKHMPYKNTLCYDETTPRHYLTNALYPYDLIGQPTYVAIQAPRNGFAHQFVSTVTFNPIVEDYYHSAYPEFPNHIIRSTWNLMDALEYTPCGGTEAFDTGFLAVKYILHAVVLPNLPTERPFSGFTSMNGYVDTSCTEISAVCFPLEISADMPVGIPFMSYMVQMDGRNADGSSTGVVIQDYGP